MIWYLPSLVLFFFSPAPPPVVVAFYPLSGCGNFGWISFHYMLFCIVANARTSAYTQQLPGNTVRVNNYSSYHVDATTVITSRRKELQRKDDEKNMMQTNKMERKTRQFNALQALSSASHVHTSGDKHTYKPMKMLSTSKPQQSAERVSLDYRLQTKLTRYCHKKRKLRLL